MKAREKEKENGSGGGKESYFELWQTPTSQASGKMSGCRSGYLLICWCCFYFCSLANVQGAARLKKAAGPE